MKRGLLIIIIIKSPPIFWEERLKIIKVTLYHGSNTQVVIPEIRKKLRALDFGAGFYLTSSKNQAEKWAKSVTKRRRTGSPVINRYQFDEMNLGQINLLQFESPTGEWLEFVVANRKELILPETYDLVIGPVANDTTLTVIDDYMDGKYTKDEAVKRLMPQNLTDQYAFLTEKSLRVLRFEGSERI